VQQGDIVLIYDNDILKSQVGIAYDSKLIISANWKKIDLIPLRMLQIERKKNINIYRTSFKLSHPRKNKIREALVALVVGQIKLTFKERRNLINFIIDLYFTVTKESLIENTEMKIRKSIIAKLIESKNMELIEILSNQKGIINEV